MLTPDFKSGLEMRNELVEVESDIADLIKEMEKSIGEANVFIKTMLEE